MVKDRIPVGTRFSVSPDRPWSPPSPLYNRYRVFPVGKVQPGRAADHSPPSSAAVMEEYSYTSTHPLGHIGPVTGSVYLFYSIIFAVFNKHVCTIRIIHCFTIYQNILIFLMFIGPCIIAIVDEWKTNLMSLAILFHFKKALNTKQPMKNTTQTRTQWSQKHNI